MCITYYTLVSTLPIYLVNVLHATKTQVGIVLAAYTLASVLMRPFAGFSLDKFGRRAVLLIALFAYTFLFIGYFIATTLMALVALRFLQGLTWGATTISGSTVAVDITPPEKRGEGIGYFALSTTLGMSTGPLIGLFVYHQWGFNAMFLAVLLTAILSLGCAIVIRLPKRFVIGRKIEFSWNGLFEVRSLLPSINLLVVMTTYGGLLSFIALFGHEIGIENTSFFFLIFSIGIALSRLMSGKAFDRQGPGRILSFCLLLMIVGFPLLALVKNEWGFYSAAFIIGYGIGVVFPTFQAIVNNLADPKQRGAANSTLYTSLDAGMGLGMAVSGVIAEKSSIATLFLVSSAICVIGLLLFRFFVLPYYSRISASNG
jgi:MFS family permease